jgi:methyl-accepting chemotaxis protein
MLKLKFKKISQKLSLIVSILMLAAFGLLTALNLLSSNQVLTAQEQKRLESLYVSYQAMISEQERLAMAIAQAFGGMPEVQKAFAEQNREALTVLLLDN